MWFQQINNFKVLAAAILLAAASSSAFSQKISKERIVSEGKNRSYYIYSPASLKPSSPAPLLVLLHGSGSNGNSLLEHWKKLADREGVILVGPDSVDVSRWLVPVDGPKFLHDLVEAVKAKHAINPRRVYLFGHSAGAGFALLMSLYESEYFAATAIHAGTLKPESFSVIALAKRKSPIHIQIGTADPLVPLTTVRKTRDELNARGFSAQLIEIPNHDHGYQILAEKVNAAAWDFLRAQELSVEPRFEAHRFKSGKTKGAAEQYKQGLRQQDAGDLAGAIAAFTRAIELDPELAEAYNDRGVAYLAKKDYAAAISDFSASIALAPTTAAYNNRGSLQIYFKKFAEAIADFSESIKMTPSADAHASRGYAYFQTNQAEQALADFQDAIKLNPKFGRAHAMRGLLLLAKGQDAEAQADFDKAFALESGLRAEFEPVINQVRANRKNN